MADIIILDGPLPKETDLKSNKLTIITEQGKMVPVELLALCAKRTITLKEVKDASNGIEVAFLLGQTYAAGDNVFTSNAVLKKVISSQGKPTAKRATRKAKTAREEEPALVEEPSKPAVEDATGIPAPEDKPSTTEPKKPIEPGKSAKETKSKIKPVPADIADAESEDVPHVPSPEWDKAYKAAKLPAKWKKQADELYRTAENQISLQVLPAIRLKGIPEDGQKKITELVAKVKGIKL